MSLIQVRGLTSTNLVFWNRVPQRQMRNAKNLSKSWERAKCQNQGRQFYLKLITPRQNVMGRVKLEQVGVVHVSILQDQVKCNNACMHTYYDIMLNIKLQNIFMLKPPPPPPPPHTHTPNCIPHRDLNCLLLYIGPAH